MRSSHDLSSISNPDISMALNRTPSYYNMTTDSHLPWEMTFNGGNLMSVVVYSVLFVVAAFGNLIVFITLYRNRHRRCRINLYVMHLSLADMVVTFFMMPLEIGWNITVSWNAGDLSCRFFMFFRAFGFYLSSFILIVISLDRYFVFAKPLTVNKAERRGKMMLTAAWVFSTIASLPQCIIFHIEVHPDFEWFKQCVTFNFFPSTTHELVYNLFNIVAVYALPLVVILYAYIYILIQLFKKTKANRDAILYSCRNGAMRRKLTMNPRRTFISKIERARSRMLKMTIVIVSVFIVCWTPYFVISTWWWFDQDVFNGIPSEHGTYLA